MLAVTFFKLLFPFLIGFKYIIMDCRTRDCRIIHMEGSIVSVPPHFLVQPVETTGTFAQLLNSNPRPPKENKVPWVSAAPSSCRTVPKACCPNRCAQPFPIRKLCTWGCLAYKKPKAQAICWDLGILFYKWVSCNETLFRFIVATF